MSRLAKLAATALLAALFATAGTASAQAAPTGSAAKRILGTPRSGLPWHSGVWTGAPFSVAEAENFGKWRGRKPDLVTTYSNRESWQSMASNFWSISIYQGFQGRLNYSLAPIPDSAESIHYGGGNQISAAHTEMRRRNMREVAAGKHDAVYQAQARALVKYGHGDAIVRIGWESTYLGWTHSANYSLRNDYRAMWRHVAQVMRKTAPHLVFEFNIAAGHKLVGSSSRLGAWQLYPGDDVVQLIGIDHYDWYSNQVYGSNASGMLRPSNGPGVLDAFEFARAHHKGAAVSEWGLSSAHGQGDNPAYITAMGNVFWKYRDVLVAECYFDDGQHDFRGNGFTKAGAIYRAW